NLSTFAGQGAGCLGQKYDPFRLLQDPSRPGFEVQALRPPADVSLERLDGRRGLWERFNRQMDQRLSGPGLAQMGAHYEQAFNLIGSTKFRKAFDLKEEPEPLRERYGKNKLGQGTLLARRLIEHGVPLVTVFWNPDSQEVPGGWDTHVKETPHLKVLLPPTD